MHSFIFVYIHKKYSHQNLQSTECSVMLILGINDRVFASGDWLKTSSLKNIYVVQNILDGWHSRSNALVRTLKRGVLATVRQLCVTQQIINIAWVTCDLK